MEYEIVATLGPASASEDIWCAMRSAGVTSFRLNTSHLTLAQLQEWLIRLSPFLASGACPHFSLVLDLQGSKWRLGDFPARVLVEGQQVRLVQASVAGETVLPVPHVDFFQAASVSTGDIVLNDAKIHLTITRIGPDWVEATIQRGGGISSRKGITFVSSSYRQEALGEKDQAIISATRSMPGIRYAVSYVKDAEEMGHYRELIRPSAYLIAKLERQPAVDQAADIARFADELWLCRGDLGAELGLLGMAETAYRFSRQVSSLPVPAILAGQVLEHMTMQPVPTRSEITSLYDALKAGYRGFVLSDETAIGGQPVEVCTIAALFKG